MIKNCIAPFKTRVWESQNRATFPWEEAMGASINTWLVMAGLVKSVGRENGTGMDHIVCFHERLYSSFMVTVHPIKYLLPIIICASIPLKRWPSCLLI